MLNLSSHELKVTEKNKGIKDYKSMSKDRILSALVASVSTRGKDHDVNPGNRSKTTRDIKRGNCEADKILRDLNMWIGAYSLITNKITRSFNMVLLGEINNSNRYIIKIY